MLALFRRLLAFLCLIAMQSSFAVPDVATRHTRAVPEVYSCAGPSGRKDKRHLFDSGLLKLALDKTVEAYGPYRLDIIPDLTHARVLRDMTANTYPNYFRSFGYGKEMVEEKELAFIPIPVFKGVLGFRTCFLSNSIAENFAQAKSLEEIKRFTHGQGTGWFDAIILEHNGLKVDQFPEYNALFNMVALNRFDLFCRGATEVKDEYELFGGIPKLAYDRSKLFYYPFPNFFYTNKSNQKAIKRIESGLNAALKDGSFDAYWQKRIGHNVEFIEIKKRQIIKLENPLVSGSDFDFEEFLYEPFRKELKRDK